MQTNFSELQEQDGLSIAAAAGIAKVSSATIRNWIKAGYLTPSDHGGVSKKSFDDFIKNIKGHKKLRSRANKAHKDQHDHVFASENIQNLLKKYQIDNIGDEYAEFLSDSYRNKEGIYYTPSEIVEDMLSKVSITPQSKFLDPCCGSGNFIMEALRRGVLPENIYGFDTDENAIAITKKRIQHEFGFDTPNIMHGDFFHQVTNLQTQGIEFDLIFTNPPWGKKIEKDEKKILAAAFGCGNSHDTSSLFMGAAFTFLKNNGFLGFLVQEAFFNIAGFEDSRDMVLKREVLCLLDYGKAFKNLITRAQALIVRNNFHSKSHILCNVEGRSFKRSQDSFKNNPKKIFNFWTDSRESEVIKQIYSVKHKILRGNAEWALGIVTGNNGRFCRNEYVDNHVPVYKGSDITKSGLKEATTFISVTDFDTFQQVAPLELYQAKEKIIYKFISSRLCFFYDNKQRYILNSANLLIPDIEISPQQLTDLLNSEIINWLFQKLFNTHKVLRGDLEELPIHIDYFSTHAEFSEQNYLNYLGIIKSKDGTFRVKRKDH